MIEIYRTVLGGSVGQLLRGLSRDSCGIIEMFMLVMMMYMFVLNIFFGR